MKTSWQTWMMAGVLLATAAQAAEIQLVAATQDKATVIIDGGRPKTLRVGQQTAERITLVKATASGADFQTPDGKRRHIDIGGIGRLSTAPAEVAGSRHSAGREILQADSRGHFFTTVSINGIAVRGMIDTGATGLVISGRQARSLGLDYRRGQRSQAATAAGITDIYKLVLNEVRLGAIVLYGVQAAVIEGDFPQEALFGNTLLNQLNMDRQGDQLILSKRF